VVDVERRSLWRIFLKEGRDVEAPVRNAGPPPLNVPLFLKSQRIIFKRR
jgi:hypothetical protein